MLIYKMQISKYFIDKNKFYILNIVTFIYNIMNLITSRGYIVWRELNINKNYLSNKIHLPSRNNKVQIFIP